MMNIYAKNGDKVIVTEDTIHNGYDSDEELAKKHLKIGGIYTVESTVVENYSTTVYLKEFPTIDFNSVNFDDYENKKVMEWDDKTKMIQLGNKRDESIEDKKEFQDFVLKHVSTFDEQAWSMFVELTDLIPDEMKNDIDYWKQIYQHVIKVDCNNEHFNFRTGMRIAFIQTICEDELKLK
jgi:hypothetical protein